MQRFGVFVEEFFPLKEKKKQSHFLFHDRTKQRNEI